MFNAARFKQFFKFLFLMSVMICMDSVKAKSSNEAIIPLNDSNSEFISYDFTVLGIWQFCGQ